MIALAVVALIIVIALVWAVSSYNSLVRMRNRCLEAEAGLDAHLKERSDLIPNIVETVKGYASHEADTLESVIEARNHEAGLTGSARAAAESELEGALGRLLAVAEGYPDLKSDAVFLDLQKQLARIEESILNARRYYNAVVREYNDRTMVFPSSIIASAFHFTSRDYVDIADSDKERVKVGF